MQHKWKWVMAVSCAIPLLVFSGICATRGIISGGALATYGIGCAEAAVAKSTVARATAWPRWSNPGTKIVPIVSLGTPGLRLGFAQVSGPKTLVTRVKAVLQLDGDFKSVRAKIMVPSDSYTDLRRVQGTAVTAVLQYKLLDFSKKKAQPVAAAQQKSSSSKKCAPKAHQDNGKHKGWYKQPVKKKGGK